MISDTLIGLIQESLSKLFSEKSLPLSRMPKVTLDHPADLSHGDYSTNIALVSAKILDLKPHDIAQSLLSAIQVSLKDGAYTAIESVSVAGPGFINITLSRKFFSDSIALILKEGKSYGKGKLYEGKKVLVEYTDPNPFKVFHIGHLMSNAIGESVSRLIEMQGAHVVRANYQGDVGLHVAKALWGLLELEADFPKESATLSEMVDYISRAYVLGSDKFETDAKAKEEIVYINKMVFDRSNPKLNKIYDWGRKITLLHFEEIYKKLGTKFDHYFFESEVAADGIAIVKDFERQGIFVQSDGALVFPGEKYGLHTRVFINSQGLPTYEAKEVGLNKNKFDRIRPDLSITVTASEQSDYFKVVLKALSLMFPYIAEKSQHVAHGMLRFADGKMSSRKGNVITGESLLHDVESMVHTKMEGRDMTADEKSHAAVVVAVGAIKYSILKQAAGSDIVYDFDKSISFEGDSGPYLQYACVRAGAVLAKGEKEGLIARVGNSVPMDATVLEKMLYRFPEVLVRATHDLQPHHVATYIIELSALFNSYYASTQIVDKGNKESEYRLALTKSFQIVLENGLSVLGIVVPRKM